MSPAAVRGAGGASHRLPLVLSIIYICSSFVTLWEHLAARGGHQEASFIPTPGLPLAIGASCQQPVTQEKDIISHSFTLPNLLLTLKGTSYITSNTHNRCNYRIVSSLVHYTKQPFSLRSRTCVILYLPFMLRSDGASFLYHKAVPREGQQTCVP